jgi:NAD-specific glutamate dehydrogenase
VRPVTEDYLGLILIYSPILDLDEAISADPDAELGDTVHRIYRSLAEAFIREPRVAPAMLPEVEMPELSQACEVFADNFLRAVAT